MLDREAAVAGFHRSKIGYVLFGDFDPPLPTLRICPRMPGWLFGITEIVGVEFSTKSIPTVEN